MRNELYTNVLKLATETHSEHVGGKRRLTGILGDKMGRIVTHAQASINRGLLAEALYLASTGEHDPHAVIQAKWDEMVGVIGEANTAKTLLASFFNRTFVGQEQASVIVLPIGEGSTFTPFNDMETLEKSLRSEPELVSQLIKQGRNRLSIGALCEAAQHITAEQLAQYHEFLATMAKYRKNDDWVVRIGTKRTAVNVFGYKGLEAIRSAQAGNVPKAGELAQGLAAITAWLVDTALNHKHVIRTIPASVDNRFWVAGRVDNNPDWDYYAGEEAVEVRFAHFELHTCPGNNKRDAVQATLDQAVDSWVDVAGWIATARQVHNTANHGVKPLTYRLRSGLETESLVDVLKAAHIQIEDRAEKKEAEFAAKRAGGTMAEARDAKEGWDAATKGVLNASQKAQLAKLRKQMGFGS